MVVCTLQMHCANVLRVEEKRQGKRKWNSKRDTLCTWIRRGRTTPLGQVRLRHALLLRFSFFLFYRVPLFFCFTVGLHKKNRRKKKTRREQKSSRDPGLATPDSRWWCLICVDAALPNHRSMENKPKEPMPACLVYLLAAPKASVISIRLGLWQTSSLVPWDKIGMHSTLNIPRKLTLSETNPPHFGHWKTAIASQP